MTLISFSGPSNCVNTQYTALSGAMKSPSLCCRRSKNQNIYSYTNLYKKKIITLISLNIVLHWYIYKRLHPSISQIRTIVTSISMMTPILSASQAHTVKPVLSGHSKRRQKFVFKTDYCLMLVKSIAECSKGSILQYFQPSLSYHLSLRPSFCLFFSGRLRQVLLYTCKWMTK